LSVVSELMEIAGDEPQQYIASRLTTCRHYCTALSAPCAAMGLARTFAAGGGGIYKRGVISKLGILKGIARARACVCGGG